jgi:hypothetical protein
VECRAVQRSARAAPMDGGALRRPDGRAEHGTPPFRPIYSTGAATVPIMREWLGIAVLGVVTTFVGMATWTATQGMGEPGTLTPSTLNVVAGTGAVVGLGGALIRS